jgi:hypothetical protein
MIQFRTPQERAAMRNQRKIKKAMRKGVDSSRIQNVGGDYGGSLTTQEQMDATSGKEKIVSNIQDIGISTATQLATGGLGQVIANPLTSKLASSNFIENLSGDPLQQAKAVEKIVSKTQKLINKVPRAVDQLVNGDESRLMTPSVMEMIGAAKNYGVNPEDEKATTPSGPEYSFFDPNALY